MVNRVPDGVEKKKKKERKKWQWFFPIENKRNT